MVNRDRLRTWHVALLLSLPLSAAGADRVVARVDGTEITRSQVEKHLDRALGESRKGVPPEALEKARSSVREQLIRTLVIEQHIRELKLTTSRRKVREKIQFMRQKARQRYQGTKELEDLLREGHSHLRFLERVLHGTLALYDYIDKRTSDEKVKLYFRSNPKRFQPMMRARHILIPFIDLRTRELLSKKEQLEAWRQIERIRSKIAPDGANFEAMARKHSQCPTREYGGDLGWFPKHGKLNEDFARAAWALNPGEVSAVVKTLFGYHLIQLTARREPTWQDAREPCVVKLQEDYLHELLKRANIERLD